MCTVLVPYFFVYSQGCSNHHNLIWEYFNFPSKETSYQLAFLSVLWLLISGILISSPQPDWTSQSLMFCTLLSFPILIFPWGWGSLIPPLMLGYWGVSGRALDWTVSFMLPHIHTHPNYLPIQVKFFSIPYLPNKKPRCYARLLFISGSLYLTQFQYTVNSTSEITLTAIPSSLSPQHLPYFKL